MKKLRLYVFISLILLVVLLSGCTSKEGMQYQASETNMKIKWQYNFSTPTLSPPGITSDGKHIALIESANGELVFLDRKGVVWKKPTGCKISVIEMTDEAIFVVGDCQGNEFYSGLNVLNFEGIVVDVKKYWYGLVADTVKKSPNGNYVCYLVSGHIGCYNPNTNVFWKYDLKDSLYNEISVSNDGYVVVGSDGSTDKVALLKDGKLLWVKKSSSHMAYVYGERIVMADNGSTFVLNIGGEILTSSKGEIKPMLNSKYIVGYYNDSTWVFDYNLKPLFSFGGVPIYLNEKYLVTSRGDFQHPSIYCYDLTERKEVWNFTLEDRFRWLKMSDDAKNVVAISEDGSKAWLIAEE